MYKCAWWEIKWLCCLNCLILTVSLSFSGWISTMVNCLFLCIFLFIFLCYFSALMGNWSTMQTKLSSYLLILLRSLGYAAKVAPNCDFRPTMSIRNIILTVFSVFIGIFVFQCLIFMYVHTWILTYLLIQVYVYKRKKFKLHYKNVCVNEKIL